MTPDVKRRRKSTLPLPKKQIILDNCNNYYLQKNKEHSLNKILLPPPPPPPPTNTKQQIKSINPVRKMSSTQPSPLKRSSVHFYEDGDCELIAETTVFRIHKNIISLSSIVFKDLFQSARPTSDDLTYDFQTGRSIPKIPLTDESMINIEMLLSFLYPNTFFEIDWEQVASLLYLADKYMIDTLTSACVSFLKRSFHEQPMNALKLAETYGLAPLYKESSKLVLDSFDHIFYDPRMLNGLSKETVTKLKCSRQEYVEGLNKIYCVTVDRQFPGPSLLNEHLRTKFEECVKDICAFPLPSPSDSWRKLNQVDCSRHFECREELRRLRPFIREKVVMMFGRYEPLQWKNSRNSYDEDTCYPFIELAD